MAENELLTVNEVAQIMKVHPDTVRRWLREGSLQGRRVRWEWRVKRADFERFLASGVPGSSNGAGSS